MTTISQLHDNLLLPQVLSAVIEQLANKALALSVHSTVLGALDQKTLSIHLAELNFPLSFSVNAADDKQPIIVGNGIERSCCAIHTSISTLKKLKAEQQITQLIKAGELDVEGDIKVAQQFANIAQQIDIDWQSELAKHLGDVPTHQLNQFGNKITKKIKYTNKQLAADVTEYLVHEKKLVVTKGQISQFSRSVDVVQQQVDDLAERMAKLAERITT